MYHCPRHARPLAKKLGMSSSVNGILFGSFGAGIIIGGIVSSIISDRLNIRKLPMVIGLVGLGVTSAFLAISTAFWQLVLARIAQGISSGISWAIGLSMIADVYPGSEIGTPMGFAFMGYTFGYLGGPIFGGFLYQYGGMHAIAIFIAGIVVIDLAFRLMLVEPKDIKSKQRLHEILHNTRQDSAHILSTDICSHDPSVADIQIEASVADALSAIDVERSSATKVGATGTLDTNHNAAESRSSYLTMWKLLSEMPIAICCLAAVFHAGCTVAIEPILPIELADKYNLNSGKIGTVMILPFPSLVYWLVQSMDG